jgi:alcohol dehydrogenase class IV
LFRAKPADAIIGVGGGTAIDMAKLVNICATEDKPAIGFVKKETGITKPGKFLIAIPTTSGTGSEATCFAVVYVNKKKYSLEHRFLLPDYAIVDPDLTLSMPERLTAVTGLDALCQGIESYWSIRSTPESTGFAGEAIRLCIRYLKKAVLAPDKESRERMALAAHLAGKAINVTRTTGPHAFSYYFTSYHDVPHGYAAALTLGSFIAYNSEVTEVDVADARGAGHVKQVMENLYSLMGAADASGAGDLVQSLIKDIGLSTSLRSTGFSPETEMDAFLSEINPDRLENNPRKVTKEAAEIIVADSL